MMQKAKSIRPFLGAKNFEISRQFYAALGFNETVLWEGFSVFEALGQAFYLQDAYVKDWVDNTMVFLELPDVEAYYKELLALDLPSKFENVRVTAIKYEPWGKECFLHDPSGILWHFGQFN